jgi:hypothetical protein
MPDLIQTARDIERDGYLLDSAAAEYRHARGQFVRLRADLGEVQLALLGVAAGVDGLRAVTGTTARRRWWQW